MKFNDFNKKVQTPLDSRLKYLVFNHLSIYKDVLRVEKIA